MYTGSVDDERILRYLELAGMVSVTDGGYYYYFSNKVCLYVLTGCVFSVQSFAEDGRSGRESGLELVNALSYYQY